MPVMHDASGMQRWNEMLESASSCRVCIEGKMGLEVNTDISVDTGQCVMLMDCSAAVTPVKRLPEASSSALLTSVPCSIMSLKEER